MRDPSAGPREQAASSRGKKTLNLSFCLRSDQGSMELTIVLIISVLSLAFAVWLTTNVLKNDTGTAEMQVISNAIKEGAEAFLRRQYKTITMLSVVFAAIIFVLYGFLRAHNRADPVSPLQMAGYVTVSFIFGAFSSGIAGYIGMWV